MKKTLILILAVLLFAGCESAFLMDGVDIEINDRLFISQVRDIYENPETYMGKAIRYEGIFDSEEWEGQTYYSVFRYGPGCCDDDVGLFGFEVVWDGEYPAPNEWVEVIGVPEQYEANEIKALRLRLSSLTALPVRGQETVSK